MNDIKLENILIAISNKSAIDRLLPVLRENCVRIWATEGTANHIKKKGYKATSIVSGFDFDGRVKSLDRKILAQVLADKSQKTHLDELDRLGLEPFDLVVVDLYKLDARSFPQSMDIGGVALIRAAVKNYKNVALAFDGESIVGLISEIKKRSGSTSLPFRKTQAAKGLKFIAKRINQEAELSKKL